MSLLSSRKRSVSPRIHKTLRIKEFPGQVTSEILRLFKVPEGVQLVLWLSNWKLIGFSESISGDTFTSYLHMLNTDNSDGYNHIMEQVKVRIHRMRLSGYYDPSLSYIAKTMELRLKEAEIPVEVVGDVTKSRDHKFDVIIYSCKTTREVTNYVNSQTDYEDLLAAVNRLSDKKRSVRTLERVCTSKAPVSMRRPSVEPPTRPLPKSARRPSDIELKRF